MEAIARRYAANIIIRKLYCYLLLVCSRKWGDLEYDLRDNRGRISARREIYPARSSREECACVWWCAYFERPVRRVGGGGLFMCIAWLYAVRTAIQKNICLAVERCACFTHMCSARARLYDRCCCNVCHNKHTTHTLMHICSTQHNKKKTTKKYAWPRFYIVNVLERRQRRRRRRPFALLRANSYNPNWM